MVSSAEGFRFTPEVGGGVGCASAALRREGELGLGGCELLVVVSEWRRIE